MTRKLADRQSEARTTRNINPLKNRKPLADEVKRRITEKLIATASDGNIFEAKKLIAEGADVNGKGFEWPPIVMAAVNRHTEMLLLLGMKEADLEKTDALEGRSAMHWAALNGHYECVITLDNLGSRKDVKDNRGKTPRQLAIENRHYQVAEFLEE